MKPTRFADANARAGTFLELTAFDGDIEIMFHVNARTGIPFDAYTYTRFIDDERFGLKSRHFQPKKGLFTHALPEFIPYLWKHWNRWIHP